MKDFRHVLNSFERRNRMIGLLQRVSDARVVVDGAVVAAIGRGLLVLVGMERGDDRARAERLLERLLGYRVFPDAEGRMNLSLRDIGGGLLLVPQFTLAADTGKGARASFSSAAPPGIGRALFEHLVAVARARYPHVGAGLFGADMKVMLTNDGPVTFWLRVTPEAGSDQVE
jgi:D-tyrosyl-tRNA(Tyr) deacylase